MLHPLILPGALATSAAPATLRRAALDDLRAIVRLLSEDQISASRGDPDDGPDSAHRNALGAIIDDDRNDIVVTTNDAGLVVGTLQLTLIPGMARQGSTRLLVEAVRVARGNRSSGGGGALLRWVTDVAAAKLGADLIQLTSDAARKHAHRFYSRLGFVDSHIGFKYRRGEPGAGTE